MLVQRDNLVGLEAARLFLEAGHSGTVCAGLLEVSNVCRVKSVYERSMGGLASQE